MYNGALNLMRQKDGMENSVIATKSNHLIQASYKLTLNEQRLVLMAIGKIFPKKPMGTQRKQRITALEYAEMFGVKTENAYRDIKKASDRLLVRLIKTYDKDPEKQGYYKFQWASHVYYSKKEGYVDITFHERIDPYLTMLSNGFYTKIEVNALSGIRSTYAIRMYELLKQYKDTGKRYISLVDFRKWCEIETKYPMYNNLKRRVINPAIKELEDKANLIISWDEVKKGRKVVGFDFMFEENQQLKLF